MNLEKIKEWILLIIIVFFVVSFMYAALYTVLPKHWRKNKTKYFVSYLYEGGFGSCVAIFDYNIKSLDEIRELEKTIAEKNDLNKVIIMNFKKVDWE